MRRKPPTKIISSSRKLHAKVESECNSCIKRNSPLCEIAACACAIGALRRWISSHIDCLQSDRNAYAVTIIDSRKAIAGARIPGALIENVKRSYRRKIHLAHITDIIVVGYIDINTETVEGNLDAASWMPHLHALVFTKLGRYDLQRKLTAKFKWGNATRVPVKVEIANNVSGWISYMIKNVGDHKCRVAGPVEILNRRMSAHHRKSISEYIEGNGILGRLMLVGARRRR